LQNKPTNSNFFVRAAPPPRTATPHGWYNVHAADYIFIIPKQLIYYTSKTYFTNLQKYIML
ncbi:hypothetical protein Q5M87_00005, partial [Brachyspira innocens]|uniref:hypothetical protein n=1 Tax=Brachyspira innocens TaxID=13264 RepID=UPI0026EB458A